MARTCSHKKGYLLQFIIEKSASSCVNSILYPQRKEDNIMKTKVHKLISTALLGMALCSQSLPAWAGYANGPSSVSIQGDVAAGYLRGARDSADNTQFIQCGVHDSVVNCNARNQQGNYWHCSSDDPRLRDAVKAMTDSSYLSIRRNGSTCTELIITNASRNLR